MTRHQLSFRGQDHEIPAGCGKCTRCGALLEIEEWLTTECPKAPSQIQEDPTTP